MNESDEEDLLEKDKIKKISLATLDDEFSENKETKLYKIRNKSYDILQKLDSITPSKIESALQHVKLLKKEMGLKYPALFDADPMIIFCHVDLDSFYASVESLENPEYKTIPLGVGNMNMLATCNYVARKYGIRAGMPGYMAKQLCPTLKIVKCDFQKYNFFSEQVMSVLSIFDEEIEIYGIDEACLTFDVLKFKNSVSKMNMIGFNISLLNKEDKNKFQFKEYFHDRSVYVPMTSTKFNFINIKKLIDNIRHLVFLRTGLTISGGISVTRGLSKYACGINKPNGSFVIDKDFDGHILDLETDKINGIGSATKEFLAKSYKIRTIRELRDNLHFLYLTMPYKSFKNLFYLSYGLSIFDFSDRTNKSRQSVGKNVTFRSTIDHSEICTILWRCCTSLSDKLKMKNIKCNIITLNYKTSNFSSKTKQIKLNKKINEDIEIFNVGYDLLMDSKLLTTNKNILNPIRLLGITRSGFSNDDSNGLSKFLGSVYEKKICPVCKKASLHLNNFLFESHVNSCINAQQTEETKRKSTLDAYIKKKNRE
ncbi:DNA polymerase kappa (polK) [Vairimorpha necatrix]|uniref:DNA polymerase kappa n=1 Tax=Vairimorpha necatrix TaxID=6039 RepID=A0AAX4J9T6_9MICR